jgi:hypothetical protein
MGRQLEEVQLQLKRDVEGVNPWDFCGLSIMYCSSNSCKVVKDHNPSALTIIPISSALKLSQRWPEH